MSSAYLETQGNREYDLHPDVWDGRGAGNDPDDDDQNYDRYFGHDLCIASPKEQLEALGREIDALRHKQENGKLVARQVHWSFLEGRATEMHEQFHMAYEKMAEVDKKYARAIQDWVIEELKTRHPDYRKDYTDKISEQLLDDLLETIGVLDSLMFEFTEDEEDHRLIEMAQTWRLELIADVIAADIQQLYHLALAA